MSVKRYEIWVDGIAEADVTELFPDPGDPTDPTVGDLLGLLEAESSPFEAVLVDWCYADDLTLVIRDRVTGAIIEVPGWSGAASVRDAGGGGEQ